MNTSIKKSINRVPEQGSISKLDELQKKSAAKTNTNIPITNIQNQNTLTLLWKVQSLVRHKRSNGLWLHGNGIIISRQSVTRRPCCNGSTRRTAWTREIGTWSITPIIFSQYGMDAPAVPGIP